MDHYAKQYQDVIKNDWENYRRAVEEAQRYGSVSILHLQRVLFVGYNRAARIVEAMEYSGIIGKPDAKGHRKLFSA